MDVEYMGNRGMLSWYILMRYGGFPLGVPKIDAL